MAGFGGFTFAAEEEPEHNQDSGWVTSLKLARASNLGSIRDSIVTLAVGSSEREFTVWLTRARYQVLQALMNTVATFTDWDSAPDARSAFLAEVEPQQWATPTYGDAAHTVPVRVKLLSQ